MEGIRQVGLLLCTVSLGASVLCCLLPKTALSGVVKGCGGVFFCVLLLTAVKQQTFSFDVDFDARVQTKAQTVAREAAKQTLTLTEHAVSDAIYGDLRRCGYAVQNVGVSLHILSDNSIEIKQISIWAEDDIPAIKAYLEREYGITPKIIPYGEEP